MTGWNIFFIALNVGCAVLNVMVGNAVLAAVNAAAASALVVVMLMTR